MTVSGMYSALHALNRYAGLEEQRAGAEAHSDLNKLRKAEAARQQSL